VDDQIESVKKKLEDAKKLGESLQRGGLEISKYSDLGLGVVSFIKSSEELKQSQRCSG